MRQTTCVVSFSHCNRGVGSNARKSQENKKGEEGKKYEEACSEGGFKTSEEVCRQKDCKEAWQENCHKNSRESGGKKVFRTEGSQKEQGRRIRSQSCKHTFRRASFESTGHEDGVEDQPRDQPVRAENRHLDKG